MSNDFESLRKILNDNGVPEENISELHSALLSDTAPKCSDKFGKRVSAGIAKMTQKVSDGSWNIAIGVGVKFN